MYLLLERNNDNFRILDTEDSSKDWYTREELRNLYISYEDTVIYGLSYLNITANVPLHLVVRLYSEDNIAKDFDGYTLTDACNEYDSLRYQILDIFNEPVIANDIELFSFLFDMTREVNKSLYDERLLQSTNYMYEVYSVGDTSYRVKDSNGDIYIADAFTAPYIYFIEGVAIKGLTLSLSGTKIGDHYYGIKSAYMNYFDCKPRSNVKPINGCISTEIQSLEADYKSIASEFGINDILYLENSFPLINVFKHTRQFPDQSCLSIKLKLAQGLVNSVSMKSITLTDGTVCTSKNTIAESFRLLHFVNDDLKDELMRSLEGYQAKCTLADKYFDLRKFLASSIKLTSYNTTILSHIKPGARGQLDMSLSILDRGAIIVSTENNVDDGYYGNIFLTRFTQVGSMWLDFNDLTLKVETMTKMNRGSCLSNDTLLSFIDYAKRNKISYYEDNIIPLCIYDIALFEDTDLSINVLCLMQTGGKTVTHSISIVKVPLIFTGCRNEKYSDGWVFRLLFQTVYISDEVVKMLYGCVNISDLIELYPTNTKSARYISKALIKSTENFLRGIRTQ